MEENSTTKIKLHPGNEYHGSLQAESLQVLTYLKLANCLHNTHTVIEESCYSSTPVIINSGKKVSRPLNIILQLQEQGLDTDRDLTRKQKSELVPLDALLTDRLRPALLYLQWLDNENYLSVTREAYGKLLSFPLSLFYLSWTHNSVKQLLMKRTAMDVSTQDIGTEVLARAGKCLSLLSAKLGTSDYFCSSTPTSYDVLVFGYLDLLLQLTGDQSLPSNWKFHKNLETFCIRMRRELYPNKRRRAAKVSSSSTTEDDDKSKKWSTGSWLFVGAGVAALTFQGFRMGLFSRLGL